MTPGWRQGQGRADAPGADLGPGRGTGLALAREELLEPGFAAEVDVLLGAEPVCDAAFRQLDVGVGEHLVLGHRALQPAALDQALGVLPRAHLLDVHRLTVGAVHPVLVQDLAGLEVTLGHRAHLHHRPAERRCQLVAEEHHPGDGERGLEVHQVVRHPEQVQRPGPHLVELEVVPLLRVGMLGQDERLDQRRPHRVVDHAPEGQAAPRRRAGRRP